MEKYGEYILETRPLPAQKKNQLVFLKEVHWTSEDGRKRTTTDEILVIDVAPLQEELVRKALSLFKTEPMKKTNKGPIGSQTNPSSTYPDTLPCPMCKKEMYPGPQYNLKPQVQYVIYSHETNIQCKQTLMFHFSKELTEKNYVPNNKEAKEKAAKELTKQQVKQ